MAKKNSDTPMSDAAEIKVQCGFKETGTGQVPSDKAREIERHWNECKAAAKNYLRRIDELTGALAEENYNRQTYAKLYHDMVEAVIERDAVLGLWARWYDTDSSEVARDNAYYETLKLLGTPLVRD